MQSRAKRWTAAMAAALLGIAAEAGADAPTASEAARGIGLELNRLADTPDGCTVYLVIDNARAALDSLALDLVAFDADGLIVSRIALELGPLRGERTTVKAYPVASVACARLGSVLVNEVLSCTGPGAMDDCLSALRATSRLDVTVAQ